MILEELYKQYEPKKEIWVSQLVFCPMKAYLMNVKPKKEPKNAFVIAGLYIHELLEEKFSECYDREKEVLLELGNGWVLKGKIDLFDPIDNTVIEIKTTSYRVDGVKDSWKQQANLYAYLLGCKSYEIWVVELENGNIHRFEFETDKALAEELIATAKRVVSGENIRNTSNCAWCVYSDDCGR